MGMFDSFYLDPGIRPKCPDGETHQLAEDFQTKAFGRSLDSWHVDAEGRVVDRDAEQTLPDSAEFELITECQTCGRFVEYSATLREGVLAIGGLLETLQPPPQPERKG